MFNDLGLSSTVNPPTYKDGNILDLLLTNEPSIIKNVVIEPDHMMCSSDHYGITFNLNKNVPRKKPRRQNVFKYSDADWEGLSTDLNSHKWKDIYFLIRIFIRHGTYLNINLT